MKLLIDVSVSLVCSPISFSVAPLYFLSRYRPANIIGPPTAHVTPVGSGIHSITNPSFCIFFPGADALLICAYAYLLNATYKSVAFERRVKHLQVYELARNFEDNGQLQKEFTNYFADADSEFSAKLRQLDSDEGATPELWVDAAKKVKSIENAKYINSFFPKHLVELSKKYNYKVIHISTDCVFSGTKGLYNEYSIKDAIDGYGITKSKGEIDAPGHLTIRTSIIGPDLKKNGLGSCPSHIHSSNLQGHSRLECTH